MKSLDGAVFELELVAVFDFLTSSEKTHQDLARLTHPDDEQSIEELVQQEQLVPIMALTYGVSIFEYYLKTRFQNILNHIVINRGPYGLSARRGEEPSTVDSAVTNVVKKSAKRSGRNFRSIQESYSDVFGLQLSSSGVSEERIAEIREVRHSIIHNSGQATDKLMKNKNAGFKKGAYGDVQIDNDYVRNALHDLRKIVEYIDDSTQKMFDGCFEL